MSHFGQLANFELQYQRYCYKRMTKVGGKYKKINGCTRQLECEQIFWVLNASLLIGLYSYLVVPPIVKWKNAAMIFCTSAVYFLFIPIIIDYLILTCTDPVDPRVLSQSNDTPIEESKRCSICEAKVGVTTEHCLNCKRCTVELDHHSQLFNNCISRKNIGSYLRLNCFFCIAVGLILAQCSILFYLSLHDEQLNSFIVNRWAIVALGIMSIVSFLFSFVNSLFSLYLYCKNMSRLDYDFRDTDSNNSDFSDPENFDEPQSKYTTQNSA